ncbi:PAS domain-containing hybrid sensor histidine kinase/response regulator [Trinickia acidisoli]|uniref:PAS domain-containing hybrid sensor histidine kinase/response regulator n=1 Tax=Trinickia acidisoli TaxID=2767482 RepID=UPI001A8E8FB3|nr:ATP-binding protein [Trinickia acidisoli]
MTSEERLRILLESVQDYAIYLLDADGCIISWNSGAEKIKGYTAQEVLGQHFSMFYPPDDIAKGTPAEELAAAARTGRVEDEGWRVRKDGTMFWANVVITAVYTPGGDGPRLRGFAKVTRDMTERKRLRELEAASQHMNEFLATLAHELRNPLAPVSNALSVMMLEPLVSPALRQCRDMIDRQISHLTRLVDDLLDAGRITTGKVALRLEPVELSDIVVRAIEMIRPHVASRQQTVEIGAPPAGIVVNGDATRLVQVVQSLLNNASKFSEHGGRIGIEIDQVGAFARLRVSDEGCGIDATAIESIFDLFVQADNRFERKESGLGIGLTLCRWLVEMHGGSIEAESAGLGSGATFTVRLPLFAVQDAANDEGMHGKSAGTGDLGALAVLVVDDNRDSADSMAMLLRMKGHRVQVAYSGAQALDVAGRAEHIDVALIDIAMPGADGFAVLRQLKEVKAFCDACFAAMTGFGQESDVARSLDQGFDLHLTKPVQLPLLDTLLARAGERRARS